METQTSRQLAVTTEAPAAVETAAPMKFEAPVNPNVGNWIFLPTSLKEAMEIADMLSRSNLIPAGFRGKPGDVLIALQMGAEIGLGPAQALQGIAVINGVPSLWGDTLLALVRAHSSVLSVTESLTGTGDDRVATCTVRRNMRGVIEETTRTFTWHQAKTAKLDNKDGPWKAYPNRMLQMRARGFALRDAAADILKGLALAEEVRDFEQITPVASTPGNQALTASTPAQSKTSTMAARLAEKAETLTPPVAPAAETPAQTDAPPSEGGEKTAPSLFAEDPLPDFQRMSNDDIAGYVIGEAMRANVSEEATREIVATFGKLTKGTAAGVVSAIRARGAANS